MSLPVAIALLASELPDLGKPSIVAIAGAAGTFVGASIPRVPRLPAERANQMMGTGTWIGLGVGFATWFVAIAMDRL